MNQLPPTRVYPHNSAFSALVKGVNQESAATPNNSRKISEVLFERPRRNFATIASCSQNVQAIEAGLLFANREMPLVAIVGPSGWGKSHLIEAVSTHMSSETYIQLSHNAAEWALGGLRSDPNDPLILDNLHEALSLNRVKQGLRIGLERRVKSHKPTLLTFGNGISVRQIKAFLPDSRAWVIVTMGAPELHERLSVVERIAESEGLTLSPELGRLLSSRIKGNGRTLVGAIKRLKLDRSDWANPDIAIRACGALDPFLADNSGWDPREAIQRAVEENCQEVSAQSQRDFAIYIMLRLARLSEVQVASFFDIEPTYAYLRANELHRKMQASAKDHSLILKITREGMEKLMLD